jgi:hypothetical protein
MARWNLTLPAVAVAAAAAAHLSGPTTPSFLQPHQPGMEVDMDSKPIYIRDSYKGSGKLQDKVAIITGEPSPSIL